jgi:hypothetical protein
MTSQGEWGESPRMVSHESHSVIEPVTKLAERAVTGGSAADVQRMINAAENSLAALKQEFPIWMANEFSELEKIWAAYQAGAPDGQQLLFRKVHDMRGQAATFGYPLAGVAADLLCKLMDALQNVPDSVIEAHIQTINVIIRQNVNVSDHPLGVQMVKELEKLGYNLIRQALRKQQTRA